MELKCPHCQTVIDGYKSMRDPGDVPSPGNLMICLNCLSLCKYADDLSLAELTEDEKAGFPPEFLFEINSILEAIKKKKQI